MAYSFKKDSLTEVLEAQAAQMLCFQAQAEGYRGSQMTWAIYLNSGKLLVNLSL